MSSIVNVKVGDIVHCEVKGDRFFAEVQSGPVKVSPRVHEIEVKPIAPGRWQSGVRYSKVRGRSVLTIYRKLKA